jgi:hypothetical protein
VKVSFWASIGFLLMLSLFYVGWDDPEYPSLQKAERFVRYVSSERQLKRSSFLALAGKKTPSHFVMWMFSPMGYAEWYVVEGSNLEFSADELKMIQRSGIPSIPSDVAIVSEKPNLERGKQVVVRGNNVKNMIIAESYLNPNEPPVRIREWEFPQY